MKKYELTDITIEYYGRTLHRIKALKNFGNVKEGDLGGFVESENNLSQDGNCWVYDNAKVFGDAIVCHNATVCNNAKIGGFATICGNAKISGRAVVCDSVIVRDYAIVCDNAEISDHVLILGKIQIGGNTIIYGNVKIDGFTKICERAEICSYRNPDDDNTFLPDEECDSEYENNEKDKITDWKSIKVKLI